MNLFIDNKSGCPIYEQIYVQIKAQIISGELKEDEPLPSIRNLAKDLRISVITTKRAYDELEKVALSIRLLPRGVLLLLRMLNCCGKKISRKLRSILRRLCNLQSLAT